MKAMRVELAFFDGNEPLARGNVLVQREDSTCEIISERGDKFKITRRFEEPASSFFVRIFDRDGEPAGRSAMRMGVHNSDDWEKIDLSEPYEMCFKCAVVDCENPDWATQDPLPDFNDFPDSGD